MIYVVIYKKYHIKKWMRRKKQESWKKLFWLSCWIICTKVKLKWMVMIMRMMQEKCILPSSLNIIYNLYGHTKLTLNRLFMYMFSFNSADFYQYISGKQKFKPVLSHNHPIMGKNLETAYTCNRNKTVTVSFMGWADHFRVKYMYHWYTMKKIKIL